MTTNHTGSNHTDHKAQNTPIIQVQSTLITQSQLQCLVPWTKWMVPWIK